MFPEKKIVYEDVFLVQFSLKISVRYLFVSKMGSKLHSSEVTVLKINGTLLMQAAYLYK